VAISDDGNYLIAGNYVPTTAVILDAHTLEPLRVFQATAADPEGEIVDSRVATILDVSPDLVGPYFLVALKEAGQVWRIDWSQPDFPVTAVSGVGHILHDGFLSPDNSTFYLAAQTDDWMAAIDVQTMQVVERIDTGITPHPGSGATWEDGGVEYAATVHAGEGRVTVWDIATGEIAGTIDTPGPGLFIRASEHSPYVWADSVFAEEPHSITVFEKAPPFRVVGTLDDGLRTLHPEFTRDGAFVYVSDWDGNVVRVYDAETLDLVAEVPDIVTPTGIFNVSRRLETLGH
jgi:nitrite reductase (NO-forming)/hydroxylamine reductase